MQEEGVRIIQFCNSVVKVEGILLIDAMGDVQVKRGIYCQVLLSNTASKSYVHESIVYFLVYERNPMSV